MEDSVPIRPDRVGDDRPGENATSGPSIAKASTGGVAAPPLIDQSANRIRLTNVRRILAKGRSRWVVAVALMSATVGILAGLASSSSTAAVKPGLNSETPGGSGPSGGASDARSAPAQGGAAGTVGSISKSSFTLTTSARQKVTVDETASTKYKKGTNSAPSSAVSEGESVLVLGITNSTTVTATQVTVGYKPPSGASVAKVIPFQRGAPTASKQVGQIPANWSEGSGTIVGGTVANEATEAALAAYPGAIVDRVVKLSDGEYNVHYIGVNWPHHVFVSASFKVVGAL